MAVAIVRRCFEFYYRITCYICDTGKVRYGPSAWARMEKCYDKEVFFSDVILDEIKRLEKVKKKVGPSVQTLIQMDIDELERKLKEKPIAGGWEQSLTIWGDMIRDGIEEFLDLAAKKKCASYGGPGTICAKWEIKDERFWEENI